MTDMRKYAAEHGWEVGSKLRYVNSDEPPSEITAISATEIRISTPDAHAEIKRLRKVMIEQFALYREEASAHRVCHDERDMAQAQVQAVQHLAFTATIAAPVLTEHDKGYNLALQHVKEALGGESDD